MARTGKTAPKLEKTRAQGVYKRNGTYVVRVWDPRTKTRTWDSDANWSFQEAVDHRDRVRSQIKRQRRSGSTETVESFVNRWAPADSERTDYPRGPDGRERSESTIKGNRSALHQFVLEHGDRDMGSITEEDARKWAASRAWTVQTLRAMFNDAVADRLIAENPFAQVRIRRGTKSVSSGLVIARPDELELLKLAAVEELEEYGVRYFAPLVDFAAWSGMRPGELFALRWSDIDFAKSEIEVREQFNSRLGKITDTKGKVARTIVLLPQAAAALKHVERRTPAAFDPDVIFVAPRGGQMSSRTLAFVWPKVRAVFRAKMRDEKPDRARLFKPTMRFYDLRHTCASYMLEANLPSWIVAEQLGHTDNGRQVEQTYGHPSKELAREQIKRAFRPQIEHDESEEATG